VPRSQRKDPVLAGAPLLVSFAFIMGIVMTVVFPTGREYAELSSKRGSEQGADAYSIAYLTVLTRADPKDIDLRLVYVRHLAQLGRWDEALVVLEQAPHGARRAADIRALRLELLLAKARGAAEGTPERTVAFAAVHEELVALIESPPPGRALELAKLAVELGDSKLGARFYLLAADVGPRAERPATLAEAARWLRASGDGQAAADAYRRAADESPDAARRVAYLMDAAEALEGTVGACAAASVLDPVAATSEDVVLLRRAVDLLRQCDRTTDAKMLGRRLVTVSHDDAREMKAQVRRELEAGDAPGALALLRMLVAANPNDPTLNEALARVAEWAGQPQVALRAWLWLFASGRVPSGKLDL